LTCRYTASCPSASELFGGGDRLRWYAEIARLHEVLPMRALELSTLTLAALAGGLSWLAA